MIRIFVTILLITSQMPLSAQQDDDYTGDTTEQTVDLPGETPSQKPAEKERKPRAKYGMGGCGLGSLIFPPHRGQIWVAITNLPPGSYIQHFAITTASSNCTDDAILKAEVEQKVFVFHNFESLRVDAARGRGEVLTSFAYLLGCPANQLSRLGALTQKRHQLLFESKNSFLPRVKGLIVADEKLGMSCTAA